MNLKPLGSTGPELVAAFALPLSLYLLLPSYAVSGDGIKYIYIVYNFASGHASLDTLFTPGHLLYLPCMALLGRLALARTPVELCRVMLACSQVAAAGGVLLMFCTAKVIGLGRFSRWMAALSLAFAYGYWIQATDVETYAVALLPVLAGMHQMALYTRGGSSSHAVSMGTFIGLASLLHLTSVSLMPAAICAIVLVKKGTRKELIRDLIRISAAFGLVFGLPLMTCAGALKLGSPGEIATWLMSADHGEKVGLTALTIPRAIYGFARTFLFLEFFWEARTWVIAIKGAAIGAMGLWLLRSAYRARGRLPHGAVSLFGAMIPFLIFQVVLGVYYFGSDTERWVFIAPLILLMTWSVLDRLGPDATRVGASVAVVVAAINAVQAYIPGALDRSIEDKIIALDKVLPANGRVITPGLDWLSYYHFYTTKSIKKTVLIETCLRCKGDERSFFDHLRAIIDPALARGDETILTTRILDPSESRRNTPWGDIERLGISGRAIDDFFGKYSWKEIRLDDEARTRTHWLQSPPRR